jgi:hypothetical protein
MKKVRTLLVFTLVTLCVAMLFAQGLVAANVADNPIIRFYNQVIDVCIGLSKVLAILPIEMILLRYFPTSVRTRSWLEHIVEFIKYATPDKKLGGDTYKDATIN